MRTIFILSVVAVVAFILGRMFSFNFSSNSSQISFVSPNDASATKLEKQNLSETQGKAEANSSVDEVENPQSDSADQFTTLIEKNGFKEKHQILSSAFSESEAGKSFVQMFTFMSMQERAGTPESKMVDDAYEQLKEHPYEAYAEFKRNYLKLPTEFNNEVTDSIQLLSRVDLPAEERLDFLKEIASTASGNEDKNFIPTVALITIRMMPEGKEYLKNSIGSIIKSHKNDQNMLLNIIHEYGMVYPKEAEELAKSYLKK